MSADTTAFGPDAEMSATWAAYAALQGLTPEAQGRAISWIESRLRCEAERADPRRGFRVVTRGRPDADDIPF